MYINGHNLNGDTNTDPTPYGDIQLSRSISDVGVSGISVTSLSFRTTFDLETYAPCAATVTLSGIGNLPTFYIDRRTYSDGVWTVECVDGAALLDREISTGSLTKTNNTYSTSALFGLASSQCGIDINTPTLPATIPCSAVDGKTWQQLVQEISEVYCGFFYADSYGDISFMVFSGATSQDTAFEWSAIRDNGTFQYGEVHLINGAQHAEIGSGPFILEINNELVDTSSTSTYYTLTNTTFTGWSVENYISSFVALPQIGDSITFGSSVLRATRAEARIVGDKLLISAGGDIPQYGEINRKGLLQRRLDDMVSTTKVYGNGKITPYQGYIVEGTEAHT